MTTLTPEKEAELRLERQCTPHDMEEARGLNCVTSKADLRLVLNALSTERQAREAAESDAENLAHRLVTTLNRAEAAEKEVERLEKALALAGQTLMKLDATNNKLGDRALNAEAKLAALVKTAQAVSTATRQTLSGQWVITGDAEVLSCNLADALSATQPCQQAASAAAISKTAFQSRQEGKQP